MIGDAFGPWWFAFLPRKLPRETPPPPPPRALSLVSAQLFSNVFNKNSAQPDGTTTKDIIDYVVVERHIMSPDGQWRVAGKVGNKPA